MSEIRTDTINNASGDNDSGIDLSTNDQVKIKTANTTALTVDASQNVGIGETVPLSKLHVKSADSGADVFTDTYLTLENSGDTRMTILSGTSNIGGIKFGDSGLNRQGSIDYVHSDDSMRFATINSERMRIDSSGRMLLNTTAHTNGRLNVTENLSTQPCLGLRSNYSANTGNFVLFTSDNGTGAGAISHINASTVAYNTSSDYRLKQNVTYDFDATTRLKQLQPARFSWNHDDTNTLVDGFLAHEVQSVVPEAITGTHNQVEVWKDGEELPDGVSVGDNKLDEDGNTIPVYQGIDQSKLVPLLVKTIQELEARITALENA